MVREVEFCVARCDGPCTSLAAGEVAGLGAAAARGLRERGVARDDGPVENKFTIIYMCNSLYKLNVSGYYCYYRKVNIIIEIIGETTCYKITFIFTTMKLGYF